MDSEIEYESTLEGAFMALSETIAHAVRQHMALNLLANRAIEWFFTASSSNGSQHRFGIGVAFRVPVDHFAPHDLRKLPPGESQKGTEVVVWETFWKERGVHQVSVFSEEGFRRAAEEIRVSPECDYATDPFMIGVRDVGELLRKAVPLLGAAEARCRANRIRPCAT
jgi:hypothetical protein